MKYVCVDKDGSCMNEVDVEYLEQHEEMSLNDFEQTLEPSEFYKTFFGPMKIIMFDADLGEAKIESILELEKGETLDILESDKEYTMYNSDAFYLLVKDINKKIIGRYEMREEPFQLILDNEQNDILEHFNTEDEFYSLVTKNHKINVKDSILFIHS